MRPAVNRVGLNTVAAFATVKLVGFWPSLQNRGPFYDPAKPGYCCTIYAAHPENGLVFQSELNL
jgi:hypothetical protein